MTPATKKEWLQLSIAVHSALMFIGTNSLEAPGDYFILAPDPSNNSFESEEMYVGTEDFIIQILVFNRSLKKAIFDACREVVLNFKNWCIMLVDKSDNDEVALIAGGEWELNWKSLQSR